MGMHKLLLILCFFSLSVEAQTPLHKLLRKHVSTTSCDADAQKFIDSAGISGSDATAICNLVKMLKDSSVWSSLDVIYPFAGSTSTTQKWNLKDPATFKLTFNGSWTHDASGADPGTTSSDYGNTGYTPSSSGTMTTSSNQVSIDILENSSGAGSDPWDLGSYNSASQAILLTAKDPTGNAKSRNLGNLFTVANSNSTGFYLSNHTSSSNTDLYRNASIIVSSTISSGSLPSYPIFIGNTSVTGSAYSNGATGRKMDFVTLGQSLTSDQQRALYNCLQAYKTALGR